MKGSRQGFSAARSVVVDRRGGGTSVKTEVGHGTTFIIRLPIGGPVPRERGLAA